VGDVNEAGLRPTASGKARVRIAKADGARDLGPELMPWVGMTAEDGEGLARLGAAGVGEGSVVKLLFEDPVGGVSLTYAWFKANYLLPRHSHNADCTYYVISGQAQFGSETLRAGDVFHVPSDTLYAYQAGPEGVEVLEFRTAVSFDFRFSNLGKAFFDRAARITEENLPAWREQTPPEAARRLMAATAVS